MIIVRINGGLGNQMFQYATGLAISMHNKSELLLDTSDLKSKKNETRRELLLPNFNVSIRIATGEGFSRIKIPSTENSDLLSKIKRKVFRITESFKPLGQRKFIVEPYFEFCPEILNIEDNCYLSGVWQSEKYFKSIESVIRESFTLKNSPSIKTKDWVEKVSGCNSVSIHIRRGDYVHSQKTNRLHGVCSLDYYNQAIDFICNKVDSPIFFIFSDDIDWVKKNLKINSPLFYISDKNIPDYEELIIMSNCKNNITANSSFSWWGAWLNRNASKITIAPKQWFSESSHISTRDLIPKEWISL